MSSKDLAVATLLLMLVGFGSSDFAQERAECANQLVALASCLPYVGGNAKAPNLECCTGLKQVLDKSRKCLCVLIKDRDNPNLGLKVNVTLAATLPSTCHAPVNVTQCIDLLHLAPSSPDAKIFAAYANYTKGGPIPTIASSGNSTSSGTSAQEKSGGEIARNSLWIGVEIICGLLLWALIPFAI